MADANYDRLRLLFERIERLIEEKRGIEADIKEVFAEAEAVGYCPRTIRKVLARRAMAPAERTLADAMVAIYEAALGGEGPDPAVDRDEARREMAIALLEEQIEGIVDADRAARLVEHVGIVLDIRAEIAGLREMERARVALARAEGFEANPFKAVIRWIEKCAKKGRDAMRAGEAMFQMYRGTVEARGEGVGGVAVSEDPKLQKLAAKKARSSAALDMWLNTGMGG